MRFTDNPMALRLETNVNYNLISPQRKKKRASLTCYKVHKDRLYKIPLRT